MHSNREIKYLSKNAKKASITKEAEGSESGAIDNNKINNSKEDVRAKTRLDVDNKRVKVPRKESLDFFSATEDSLKPVEEDSSSFFTPMIGTSAGLLGRGLQAGVDGEIQAEKMLDKLMANLEENERSENVTSGNAPVSTVFPIPGYPGRLNDLLMKLKGQLKEDEAVSAFTEASVFSLSTSLNIVPLDLLRSVTQLKRKVGGLSSEEYISRRNELFPECSSGSQRYRNRAGDKLEAILTESGIAENIRYAEKEKFIFADVCGGPGAFSQMLFDWIPRNAAQQHSLVGIGMTLKTQRKGPGSLDWYASLLDSSKNRPHVFIPCWGPDGTGNIYARQNIESFVALCNKTSSSGTSIGSNVELVVADGGFDVTGREMFQEVLSSRLLLCETIIAMQILRDGGSYIVKTFDTLTPFSASLIYILTFCFERLLICKPEKSRVVNSERYIVGNGYRFNKLGPKSIEIILARLFRINEEFDKMKPDMLPEVLPISFLLQNFDFLSSLREPTVYWMTRQKNALERILNTKMI